MYVCIYVQVLVWYRLLNILVGPSIEFKTDTHLVWFGYLWDS